MLVLQTHHLKKPLAGDGGFQRCIAYLQAHADSSGVVRIHDHVWEERIMRYREAYGQGGFEDRIGDILRYEPAPDPQGQLF